MDTTNKIQNAIYWLNASLKVLSPCNGHVTEIPVTDFYVPQFSEPVFTQQQQEQPHQQQQQQVPLPSTMQSVPAAAAGSAEQQATNIVNVLDPEDPENPDPQGKGTKI